MEYDATVLSINRNILIKINEYDIHYDNDIQEIWHL